MRLHILTFLLAFVPVFMQAQTNTTPQKDSVVTEVFDVVAVKRSHTDGRGRTHQFSTELKGKILTYDETTGQLTFKDRDGKIYSLKSDEYQYFEYNKTFTHKLKNMSSKTRKTEGFEFYGGLSLGYLMLPHTFNSDQYYISGTESYVDIPVCVKAGASKYLSAKSTLGATVEFAFISSGDRYLNAGARFVQMYKPSKNAALYMPVEAKFNQMRFVSQYGVNDTLFTSDQEWQYPSYLDTDVTLNALELNIGQGISFAMAGKKALSFELMLANHFILSQKFPALEIEAPDSKFGVRGLKMAVLFSF